MGVTTLPFDFDIFLRSGSSTHPEIAASLHGSSCSSSSLRSTVLNSHVLMMSCAWGRTSKGNTFSNSSGSTPAWPAIWGVSDEVAQVSITSGSPAKPPGCPRCSGSNPGGTSVEGSIGSCSPSGSRRRSWQTLPCWSISYQTGNGTPKKRWRLTHQSPVRPLTQSSKRARMYGGCQCSSRPRSIRRSRCSSVRMNHCRLVMISTGRSPFSKNFTARVTCSGSPTMSPACASSSRIRLRAWLIVSPTSSE